MLCAPGKRTSRLRISTVWYYEDGTWKGIKLPARLRYVTRTSRDVFQTPVVSVPSAALFKQANNIIEQQSFEH